jgi:hypothetical protein
VPKHQPRRTGFDDKILSLYARGMTVREIQGHLQEIYGTEVLKWPPNLGQVFKWDTVQRNGLPMTETKKRRVHLPEFKAKVGLEALGGMKTINFFIDFWRSLIHPSTQSTI